MLINYKNLAKKIVQNNGRSIFLMFVILGVFASFFSMILFAYQTVDIAFNMPLSQSLSPLILGAVMTFMTGTLFCVNLLVLYDLYKHVDESRN